MRLIAVVHLIILTMLLSAQVGIGTNMPNTSATLELSSTSKGFLPPRMTLADRNAIISPTEGLMIWCNDCGVYGQIQVFNGAIWTSTSGGQTADAPEVGDLDGGGVVAYIFQLGDAGYVAGEVHGLIAAENDLGLKSWGCIGTFIGGTFTGIGTGQANTNAIVSGCQNNGIAAHQCNDLILNNYSDWYLPSKDELNKLFINQLEIGGFTTGIYWSSSEDQSVTAWGQHFDSGNFNSFGKSTSYQVRPIRSF